MVKSGRNFVGEDFCDGKGDAQNDQQLGVERRQSGRDFPWRTKNIKIYIFASLQCASHLLACLFFRFFSLRFGCPGESLHGGVGGGVEPLAIATVLVFSASGSLAAGCNAVDVCGSGVDGARTTEGWCELRKML